MTSCALGTGTPLGEDPVAVEFTGLGSTEGADSGFGVQAAVPTKMHATAGAIQRGVWRRQAHLPGRVEWRARAKIESGRFMALTGEGDESRLHERIVQLR
jgi:hypothetical protein